MTYAPLAAKNRRAGRIMVPVLDILQSVPILGFLSFTVAFFMSLFPGRVLGLDRAPEVVTAFGLDKGARAATSVAPLEDRHRLEEIARMLSGATITDEARAAAAKLMDGAE